MADAEITGVIAWDRLPGSGNEFGYVLARQNGNSAYRAAIRVNPAGAVFVQLKKAVNLTESNVAAEVATGITVTPGAAIAFRFRLVGGDLMFRVWNAGGAEPGWQATATDTTLTAAGGVGIRFYVGGPVPNGPVLASADNVAVLVP
jgi:hypothetical protein